MPQEPQQRVLNPIEVIDRTMKVALLSDTPPQVRRELMGDCEAVVKWITENMPFEDAPDDQPKKSSKPRKKQ